LVLAGTCNEQFGCFAQESPMQFFGYRLHLDLFTGHTFFYFLKFCSIQETPCFTLGLIYICKCNFKHFTDLAVCRCVFDVCHVEFLSILVSLLTDSSTSHLEICCMNDEMLVLL
jgi:hypothetical protein